MKRVIVKDKQQAGIVSGKIPKAKELGAAATSRLIALARRRRIVCALMPLGARGRLLLWVNAATTPSYALAPI